jgi:membrane fusion protein (multidrug efflux system)
MAEPAARPPARRARRALRAVMLVAVPIAAAALGLYWYAQGGRHVETDNAYVKAHIIAVSAEVAGRVIEVAVRDHQPVAAGALLFRLDPAPFEVAIARADAQMAVVRTDLDSLRAEHRVTLAETAEAESRIAFLTRQLERQQLLKERGMTRDDAVDEARQNLEAARARLEAVRQRTARVLASLGGDVQLAPSRHPRFLEAQAERDAAALDLARTRVTAPAAGIVSNMKLQPGEYVTRGVPVFSIIGSGDTWIEANFKETQLAGVRVGQAARIVADAYPGVEWRAKVRAIAPATGAEFALLPPQNATGNWVKIVQRVPVHLALERAGDAAGGDRALRAGMTVTVSIDTGRSRGLPGFLAGLVP